MQAGRSGGLGRAGQPLLAVRVRDRGAGLPAPGADAEDVFQEVFTRTWEHLGELRDDTALRPWIATATRRLCVDRLRRCP